MEENILNRPCNEERLRQAVVNVDNEVVIGDGVDFRPRKLSIYQNPLPKRNKSQLHQFFSPEIIQDDQYHNICPITEKERVCVYEPVGERRAGICRRRSHSSRRTCKGLQRLQEPREPEPKRRHRNAM